jgi:hypothetical protein
MRFNQKDVASGLIFIGIGGFFALNALQLELGTPLRMGPGFFPLGLSLILMGLGLAICLRSFVEDSSPLQFAKLRSFLLICLPPVIFGLTVRPLGLVPSIAIVSLLGAYASQRMTIPLAVALTAVLTVFCVALFHYGLGLPIPLFGPVTGL